MREQDVLEFFCCFSELRDGLSQFFKLQRDRALFTFLFRKTDLKVEEGARTERLVPERDRVVLHLNARLVPTEDAKKHILVISPKRADVLGARDLTGKRDEERDGNGIRSRPGEESLAMFHSTASGARFALVSSSNMGNFLF